MATATKKTETAKKTDPANKPRYTTGYVGTTPAGPYAFQVEGNLTRPPELRQTNNGNPVLNNSIGIGRPAAALYALADGSYDKDATYPENNFVEIVAFGDIAEEMANLEKGTRIVVAGEMSKRAWTDKAGAERESVQIKVSQFAVLSCKAAPKGAVAKTTVPATNLYTDKNGEDKMAPIACLVSGNLHKVEELGTSPNGISYLHFSMFAQEPAAKVLDKAYGRDTADKEYDEKKKLIWCSVFNKQAESLAKLLKEGMTVAVSGSISENVYNGGSSVRMSVRVLNVINFETAKTSAAVIPLPEDAGDAPVNEASPASGEVTADFCEDEEDESALPF